MSTATTRARKPAAASADESPAKEGSGSLQKLTSDGQLTKTIIAPGSGPAIPKGSLVTVHYTGKLPDGRVFDSSRSHNSPFQFKLGAGHVIAGWDQGIATMRTGERAVLSCGSSYAYGESGINDGATVIPPHATLEFDVEVLSWKADNGLPVVEIGLVMLVLLLAWYLLYYEPSNRHSGASQ